MIAIFIKMLLKIANEKDRISVVFTKKMNDAEREGVSAYERKNK